MSRGAPPLTALFPSHLTASPRFSSGGSVDLPDAVTHSLSFPLASPPWLRPLPLPVFTAAPCGVKSLKGDRVFSGGGGASGSRNRTPDLPEKAPSVSEGARFYRVPPHTAPPPEDNQPLHCCRFLDAAAVPPSAGPAHHGGARLAPVCVKTPRLLADLLIPAQHLCSAPPTTLPIPPLAR